jgi:aspartate aminotransferase
MSDEIYGEMVYEGEHVSLTTYPELAERLILLDGFSKTYAMTGWRLGYSVWPESMIGGAEALAINSHSCVNAAAQYAGIAALTGPREPVHKMVAAFAERRAYIIPALNALPGVSCVTPGGAFYAFPNIRASGHDSRALQSSLLEEAGVAALSGTSFGDQGEGYIRLSYAAGLDTLEEAVRRIGTWLESHAVNRPA